LSSCCSVSSLLFTGSLPASIYSLSLHDALPIFQYFFCLFLNIPCHSFTSKFPKYNETTNYLLHYAISKRRLLVFVRSIFPPEIIDRKSTRLNSSHVSISYAVFCLKKKKNCSVSS